MKKSEERSQGSEEAHPGGVGRENLVAVHGKSVQTGAYELIPLPFLDDYLVKRARRAMVERILVRRGISFEDQVPGLLAGGGRKTFLGKVGSVARGLIFKPLTKVFRSVLFWLTVRRAVLTMVETYFLARFVCHPGIVRAGQISNEQARKLGPIFERVVDKIDRRIAGKSLRELWRWMSDKGRRQKEEVEAEEVGRALEEEAPGILADFDQKVGEELAGLD